MRGVALVLLALGLVLAGLARVQRRRSAVPPDGAVVAPRGLYALVRHPQYLGFDLFAWGLATFWLYWGTLLPAIAFTIGVALEARGVEADLLDRFGDPYRTYMRAVPRFGLFTGIVRYLRRG
jgi:protein-S-isoprenylcysteine O-methyltransferase Ste14